jgi:MFS family permease
MEGFLYVWTTSGLKSFFFVAACLNFFTMPLVVLFPFYVEDFLKVKLEWYGYLTAIYGAGLIIGFFSAGFIKLTGKVRGSMMIICMVLSSVIASFAFAYSPITAMILALMGAIMIGFTIINILTILQISTPSEIRGRVFGFLHALSGSTMPLGMGLGGVVFDLTGQDIPLIYVSCGGIMAFVSIMASMSREFREFLAYESIPEKT